MQPLDLYASIEEYLDFEEEIENLYRKIGSIILENDIKDIIDIGCGQGEFCRILEHNGVKTFGVDLSQKQIEIASAKGLSVKAIDIKDVQEKFSAATAVFDVINYLAKDELENFFKNTYNLLDDGGLFVFDVNSLFGFEEVAQGTLSIDLDSKFISIDANFDEELLNTDITLFSSDSSDYYKKQTGTITQYFHSKERLKKVLKKVGFNRVDVEMFNLHNFEEDDKMIFICKKDEK